MRNHDTLSTLQSIYTEHSGYRAIFDAARSTTLSIVSTEMQSSMSTISSCFNTNYTAIHNQCVQFGSVPTNSPQCRISNCTLLETVIDTTLPLYTTVNAQATAYQTYASSSAYAGANAQLNSLENYLASRRALPPVGGSVSKQWYTSDAFIISVSCVAAVVTFTALAVAMKKKHKE